MEKPAPGPVSGVSGVSQAPPEVRAKTEHELLLIIAKHFEENDLASVAHQYVAAHLHLQDHPPWKQLQRTHVALFHTA